MTIYSAAIATGAGDSPISSALLRSSAFTGFASFTGPNPLIISGSSARATAVSSVSGRRTQVRHEDRKHTAR